ncbi:S41 family peptidase [Pseudoalteromonas sp. T1lg23B]|uniref:S41 family peptidase n=1 Tax=Pseudoalteromonas sp. T1lg23B TaxID=2077097 RepID=UPI000CF74BC0|nr:S41 family peptidase [Pseudoalteromonas sp. T1lg23B]
MKRSLTHILSGIVLSGLLSSVSYATDLSEQTKQQTIAKLSSLLVDEYVFVDVAKNVSAKLQSEFDTGGFAQYQNPESFAQALTEWLQQHAKDRHLRVRINPKTDAKVGAKAGLQQQLLTPAPLGEGSQGVIEASMLEDNIGYLELNGFNVLEDAKPYLDAALTLLSSAQALIIDVRKNGGGSPYTVQYLCSYFFADELLLNSLYYRQGNETQDFYVLREVGGNKLTDIPLYVLTSKRTFSAAEEFSYNMRTRKRATLVGEHTGGAANPGGMFTINDVFSAFIATGTAINPITKTNWETTGVEPHVKVKAEQALAEAVSLAKQQVETRWQATKQQRQKDIQKLFGFLESVGTHQTYNDAQKQLYLTKLAELFKVLQLDRFALTDLALEVIETQPNLAALLLEANAQQFPNSGFIYGYWAQALAQSGDKVAAQQVLSMALTQVKGEYHKKHLKDELAKLATDASL